MTLSFPTRRSSDLDYRWLGLFLLAAGNVFFEFASVNYNAMLNEISTPRTVGRVSGLGWGLGYIGGIVLLLLAYFGLINPEVGIFGITEEESLEARFTRHICDCGKRLFPHPWFINPPEQTDHSAA